MTKRFLFLLWACTTLEAQAQRTVVPNQEKSHSVAFLLELFVPMAGNIYAHNTVRGLVPNLVAMAGVSLGMRGVADDMAFRMSDGSMGKPYDDSAGIFHFSMILGGKFWAVAESVEGTTRYNKRLYAIQPTIVPTDDGLVYGLEVKW